jgi:hypothetical protein
MSGAEIGIAPTGSSERPLSTQSRQLVLFDLSGARAPEQDYAHHAWNHPWDGRNARNPTRGRVPTGERDLRVGKRKTSKSKEKSRDQAQSDHGKGCAPPQPTGSPKRRCKAAEIVGWRREKIVETGAGKS